MIVKTKKYKLETGTYIKLAFQNLLKKQWWVFLIALAIMLGYFIIASHWWITGALIALTLYFLFWLVQFAGVTQLEQTKMLFEKRGYEIDSREIRMMMGKNRAMQIPWGNIQTAKMTKDEFVFMLSIAQMIHLPFSIFKTQNEVKFVETILNRKGLIETQTKSAS